MAPEMGVPEDVVGPSSGRFFEPLSLPLAKKMGDWVLSRIARYPPAARDGDSAPVYPSVLAVHPSHGALIGIMRRLLCLEGREYQEGRLVAIGEGGRHYEYPSAAEERGEEGTGPLGRYALGQSHAGGEKTEAPAQETAKGPEAPPAAGASSCGASAAAGKGTAR